MLLFFIFNALSVYFASQILQESKYISSQSHNTITQFNVTYNALYSVLVVLGLHSLQKIRIASKFQKLTYTICCHLGALSFALAGEYPPLKQFSITPGFWGRLSPIAKLIVAGIFLIVFILFTIQGLRARKQKTCYRQWWPWSILFIIWSVLWMTILKDHYYIHVHHALFAGLFSCWFSDSNSKLDIIVNAFLTGIVIEGIDFYGIGELTLFILQKQTVFELGMQISWGVAVISLLFVILRGRVESNEDTDHVLKK